MKSRRYLQGLLAAHVAVAEVTGKIQTDSLNDQTWKLICELNARLLALALAESERLDGKAD